MTRPDPLPGIDEACIDATVGQEKALARRLTERSGLTHAEALVEFVALDDEQRAAMDAEAQAHVHDHEDCEHCFELAEEPAARPVVTVLHNGRYL